MTDQANWWEAYPAPKSQVDGIALDEALDKVAAGKLLLVDVRNQTEVAEGSIPGSTQFASHNFWPEKDRLLAQISQYQEVAFFCNRSQGRGPRSANWAQDFLTEAKNTTTHVKVLEGGYNAYAHSIK